MRRRTDLRPAARLKTARSVFLLSGAGLSAESGLGTFRDKDGAWSKYDMREVCTPEGFARDPAKVHGFYNDRRRNLLESTHNAAHTAIARLQEGLAAAGGRLFLCTQNIDDLHERGGARDVVHMHGELLKVRCLGCARRLDWREDTGVAAACPECGAVGRLRPDVVWFGEMPLHLDAIYEAVAECDLFVSIGTSGSVYPAAGLVAEARSAGARTCELNLEPSENAHAFDERSHGPATEVVPKWVDEVLAAVSM